MIGEKFADGFTNVAMAPIMAGLAGVKVEKWWKFVAPVFLCLFVTQGVLMVVAVVTGFGA